MILQQLEIFVTVFELTSENTILSIKYIIRCASRNIYLWVYLLKLKILQARPNGLQEKCLQTVFIRCSFKAHPLATDGNEIHIGLSMIELALRNVIYNVAVYPDQNFFTTYDRKIIICDVVNHYGEKQCAAFWAKINNYTASSC